MIFKELSKLKKEKVSSDELRRAKDFLLAQTEMALDDSLDHMLWMGNSLMNLGFIQTKGQMRQEINRITSGDVLKLARQLIDWERLHFAAVGPQSQKSESQIKDMVSRLS